MAWFTIALTDDEQRVVNAERDSHPDAHVRRKMLVLWLLHHGDTRERAATITGLGRATVQRYVQAFNRRHARSGPLWEGRFRSCTVDSDEYLLRCYQYIEMNPVRAGMVSIPREYGWSSYRSNAEGEHSRLLTPHSSYLCLGGDADRRSARYRDLFLEELSAEDLGRIREATNRNGTLASQPRPGS